MKKMRPSGSNVGVMGLGIGVALLSGGCLRADPGHCIFNGGDAACDQPTCAAVLEDNELPSSQDGCIDLAIEEESTYVRVPYGLLVSVLNTSAMGASTDRPQTVEDVLRREFGGNWEQGDASCDLGDEMLRGAVEESAAIRRHLEGIKGARREPARLSGLDRAEIETLNGEIDALIASCRGTGQTTGSTADTTDATTEQTSSESSGSTTGDPCTSNDMCSIDAPYCLGGECVSCDQAPDEAAQDGACADVDLAQPFCTDSGACAPCRAGETSICDAALQWCDLATNSCVPCTEHQQCTSGACELDLAGMGQCFPIRTTEVFVDGDGGQDFTSVNAAVASIGIGEHGIVRLFGNGVAGDEPYNGQVLVNDGKIVALLAEPSETPVITGTGMINPGVRVEGAGTVLYAEGLRISGNSGEWGVLVDGAFAWFDRSQIVANFGGGLRAQASTEVILRNCFINDDGLDAVALDVDGSTARVLYTTIGASTFGTAPHIACTSPMLVDIRNSIIVGQGNVPPLTMSCPTATAVTSAVDPGMFDAGWFVFFDGGNYHLTASGQTQFENIAQWVDGDPIIDIDGNDPRPDPGPIDDYPGADVP